MKMLIAAVLACVTGGALAVTHTFSLHGTASHTLDCWEDLEHCGTGAFVPYVEFPWIGTVSAVVATDADGTFSGADFVSLRLDSNVASFAALSSQVQGSITVLGGEVTSIDVYYSFAGSDVRLIFAGLTADYSQVALHHYGPTYATGILTPVPEPETYALMGAGLLLTIRLARRKRA